MTQLFVRIRRGRYRKATELEISSYLEDRGLVIVELDRWQHLQSSNILAELRPFVREDASDSIALSAQTVERP